MANNRDFAGLMRSKKVFLDLILIYIVNFEGKERLFSFLKSANSEVIISENEWNGRTLTIASPKVVHTHNSSIEKSCRLRHISLAHTYHHASAKFEQRRGYFFAVFSF